MDKYRLSFLTTQYRILQNRNRLRDDPQERKIVTKNIALPLAISK
jgi:hypothetical protein